MDATTGLFDKIDILTTNLAANASRNDKTGRVSRELVAEIASSGVLALTVPKALDGEGAGVWETSRVLRRLGRADPSVALILSMHFIQHLIIALSPSWPKHLTHKLVDDALAGKGSSMLCGLSANRVSFPWRVAGNDSAANFRRLAPDGT